jgi:hypothetical protein
MKRIAALAAVIIGLLAIPTAAMASTSGGGGSGGSGYGTTTGPQPYVCYYGVHRSHHHWRRYFEWWGQGQEHWTNTCPFPQQVPLPAPQQCQPQTLTFSVAAGSSVMTEVSGPQLSPTEEFSYGGNTYTVMTVNPGAGQFTAFVNNFLFVNQGTAITDAAGVMLCGSS